MPCSGRFTRRPLSVLASATVKKSFGHGNRQYEDSRKSQPRERVCAIAPSSARAAGREKQGDCDDPSALQLQTLLLAGHALLRRFLDGGIASRAAWPRRLQGRDRGGLRISAKSVRRPTVRAQDREALRSRLSAAARRSGLPADQRLRRPRERCHLCAQPAVK
jgi:hypothetical protein